MSLDENIFQQPLNKLLAALPASDYQRLLPHLKLVSLEVPQILSQAGEPIAQVYFPHNSMVSIVATMEDGSTAEVGIVSSEGMIGIPVILGNKITTTTSFVQISGAAMQMNADVLKAEFNRGGAIQTLLLSYIQAIYSELAQGAACNRLHTLDERLARWLLTVSDRVGSEDFFLTQEFISQMLGVRRSGVTVAASTLSRAGMISYHRGHINILNRENLSATSCECYRVIQNEFARLLGFLPSNRAEKFF
ncbi:Crp/Fnr family transcriptional regulator [Nostoc commune NIES-4072]|uniref:Crp/Fnr family transcriptional regulator n=1 Tax=Nostoc commune NIES-4072 TaxID=2005467 RepID=A0A2R5FDN9_NOSCO|nr:Crp/Fnr family transcriptional regulator [Nostoc commune]BBD66183.1 Crp/Fnr family transcriptional regulator [Nostoc commune HK-02]GBG16492.1 Crp/Fnr family transcriptional regulator [Nostoc commune NIES-4072]